MDTRLPAFVKFVTVLFGAFLIFWVMIFAKSILLPLAFAGLFSLLLLPISNKLESWRIPRALAAIICIILVGVILSMMIWFFSTQIVSFTGQLPSFSNQIKQTLENSEELIETYFGIEPAGQVKWLKQSLLNFIQRSSSLFTSTLSTTATAFGIIALIPIYTFFFLYYRDFFLQFVFYVLKGNGEDEVEEVAHKIQSVVQNYLSGLLVVIFIVGVLNSIGLLALGVEHAIFFGSFAGLLNVIPYVGVLVGSLLPFFYTVFTMDSWFYPIGVAVIFWSIQTLEGNVITPYVIGSKVRINPLAAILSLLLGGLIWGPAGMIIFIPFVAILKVVLDAVPSLRPYGFLLGLPPKNEPATDSVHWVEKLKERVGLPSKKATEKDDSRRSE